MAAGLGEGASQAEFIPPPEWIEEVTVAEAILAQDERSYPGNQDAQAKDAWNNLGMYLSDVNGMRSYAFGSPRQLDEPADKLRWEGPQPKDRTPRELYADIDELREQPGVLPAPMSQGVVDEFAERGDFLGLYRAMSPVEKISRRKRLFAESLARLKQACSYGLHLLQ